MGAIGRAGAEYVDECLMGGLRCDAWIGSFGTTEMGIWRVWCGIGAWMVLGSFKRGEDVYDSYALELGLPH